MKKLTIGLAAAGMLCASVALAQEHWTEGSVWECSAYRTSPGQFDNYMKWLRAHGMVTSGEAKKQGLIQDYKVFVKTPADPNDYDVLICNLYPSFAKALDFSQADEDKFDAIMNAHWKVSDTDEIAGKAAPRLEMRKFLGVTYVREVSLRPLD
jgi:hypothetical protein